VTTIKHEIQCPVTALWYSRICLNWVKDKFKKGDPVARNEWVNILKKCKCLK
jgi:hypothetical protein